MIELYFMSDDKTQVILSLTFIAVVSMIFFGADAIRIVESTISGLLGVAVGRSLKNDLPRNI